MRVLVVEDEADVADVFFDYLTELGHEPTIVRSAEAALGRLQSDRPDAILLDINLPGMSGVEFLQLKRIRDGGVPIVAVSGVATESQARECLRLGAMDFIGKPIALDRLNAVLECLEPHALEQRLEQALREDRRRSPRVPVTLPVFVTDYGNASWHATAVDLSPHALKIRSRETVRPGHVVRLTFTLPDGGPSLTVMSLLTREDPDGFTFFFVNPTPAEAQRLTDLVAHLSRA